MVQMLQEEREAVAFYGRQQKKDACGGGGFDCGREPEPFMLLLDDPRRTFPQRTPAPPQPGDQAKAAFV
jgi:hypothetical protein